MAIKREFISRPNGTDLLECGGLGDGRAKEVYARLEPAKADQTQKITDVHYRGSFQKY